MFLLTCDDKQDMIELGYNFVSVIIRKFQEVIKINSEIFNNEMDIKYLFTEEQDNEATYHDDIIQKSKPSKWWI